MSDGLLLFNPAAGRGPDRARLAERVAELLSRPGSRIEPRATSGPGDATRIVRERLEGRSSREVGDLLVLGGDGTLNEAVTGAWLAGRLGPGADAPRFGIVPAGTANVIARDLGLGKDPLRAAAALAAGAERPFDLGLCRSSAGERPFLLAAGVGVEAETIAAVDPALKRRLGAPAFLRAAIRVAGARDRCLEVVVRDAEGVERRRRVAGSLTCGNSRLYGGPCRLSRLASFDDGLLELLLLRSTSVTALLLLGLAARLAEAGRAPGAELLTVVEAEVRAPEPVPVHVDAELFGTTPVRLSVLRHGLRLRVPV